SGVARLDPDGSLDATFVPAIVIDSPTFLTMSMVLQTDGKIIVSAQLRTGTATSRLSLVRLNPDGSLDPTFVSSYATESRAIAIQAGGKILLGTSSGAVIRLNQN